MKTHFSREFQCSFFVVCFPKEFQLLLALSLPAVVSQAACLLVGTWSTASPQWGWRDPVGHHIPLQAQLASQVAQDCVWALAADFNPTPSFSL